MKPEERTTVINVLGAWIVLAVTACAVVGLIGFVVFEEQSETYYKLFYGAGGTLLILTGAPLLDAHGDPDPRVLGRHNTPRRRAAARGRR
jgi:hypothetical protein